MKNLFKLFLSIFLIFFVFSCSNAKVNESGWYEDFEATKKIASSKNKNILLFVNSDFDVENSEKAVSLLLDSSSFVDGVKDDYVCVHFDFTKINEVMSTVTDNMSKEEKKSLEAKRALLEKQFATADSFGIQSTPAIIIAHSKGYFITDVNFDFASNNVDGYISLVKEEKETVENFEQMVSACKKGSSLEKIKAIDTLYESQAEIHRLLLADLFRSIPEMDKKNESGLVSKYLFATANCDAYKCLTKMQFSDAVNVYKKYAEDERVSASDKQNLYYLAANILSNSGNYDFELVISLLQKALEADPESSYADGLQKTIDYLKQLKEEDSKVEVPQTVEAK